MDLSEGSTPTNTPLPFTSIQRLPTLKWLCHSTLVYIPRLKFKLPTRKCFEQRKFNVSYVKVECFEL